ncbi:MAG: hypothetical protein SGILL_003914 [Bacillariaceae sp.]
MDAVLAELSMMAKKEAKRHNNNNNCGDDDDKKMIPLPSIYFGGGTPSLAPVESLRAILHHACRKNDADNDSPFAIIHSQEEEDTEITIEMDPGTFDRPKLQALKDQVGINRISLGVQSLDDSILESMGRVHRRCDIEQAVQDIAAVFGSSDDDDDGGDRINYSIDLISGAPGLTLAKWVDTLQQVTSTCDDKSIFGPTGPPKHISIYDLQIESGTVFEKWYRSKNEDMDMIQSSAKAKAGNNDNGTLLRLPSEEECAFMYKFAAGYLRAKGYEHYEVSSYAKRATAASTSPSPWRSRHNQIYWDYSSSWYSLGLGATSFVNRTLVARPRKMDDYIEWVSRHEQKSNGGGDNDSCDNVATENESEFLPDLILKRLRTCDGLDLKWLNSHYGSEVVEGVIEGATLGLELGLAERTESDILKLKDPEG